MTGLLGSTHIALRTMATTRQLQHEVSGDPFPGADWDAHHFWQAAEAVACMTDAELSANRSEVELGIGLVKRRLARLPRMLEAAE